MFRPIPQEIDLVALEQAELDRWKAQSVFERSLSQRADAKPWVFYEGPPTANGRPGLHHVWARVYKDLFCRYQTMRGHLVNRRAGWDTHGLPVEVEVEKRLGITGKRQIEEEVGIAEFTRLCRESVLSYVDEWRAMTERIGYWTDLDDAYWTFQTPYVESVWWQLKTIFDKGLLYEDFKVVPYCPRCGTALSSHELGQPGVYQDVEDASAFVLFPIIDPDSSLLGDATELVVWTTTPWTLPSNTGAAVNPTLTYAVVDGKIVAEGLVASVFGEEAKISHKILGSDLVGLHYRRPFDDVPEPPGADAWRVVAADFVTTEDGTGIVHLAPAFGEIDRQVGRENGLPGINPVAADGTFDETVPWLSGTPVREANAAINAELERRGILLRALPYLHSYPHCWRCNTPLIYWGKPSWYIATSTLKDDMVAENEKIGWHPEHIREGRFGEWLKNNVDWALSRDRYWGTPLPIWRCEENHLTCIGSLAELGELTGRDCSEIDPHRPAIDEVSFPCPSCGGAAHRVSPVIDAWFDSGSMPAAQVGYPHAPGSKEAMAFPADFITEAIDQTRGWFYSLLAVNTMVFGAAPYRNVMCLGHIVDVDGKKMSKSVGNVIDPAEILDSRGADALRWWMFSQGSPWTPTRVSLGVIDQALRETLMTLWNTASFFTTYASLNGFDPLDPAIPAPADRPELDRWVLSRLEATTVAVTDSLEGYEPLHGAQAIATLVDELSNWYVRRSRRRFWRTDPNAPASDSLAAQATLHTVLVRVATLLSPFCPFLGDRLWSDLTGAGESESVHLINWPEADASMINLGLEAQMDSARRLTSLGRAARSEAGIKVRQPLARALVFVHGGSLDLPVGVVEDELNVDAIEITADLSSVLQFELVPNFKVVGPALGDRVKFLRPALAALDTAAAAASLEAGESIEIMLDGEAVSLDSSAIELRIRGQEGYAVSRAGGEVVALDLELNDGLRARGMVREIVRQLQDLRKASGLRVEDRITLHFSGLSDVAAMFDEIATEVLAVSVTDGAGEGEPTALDLDDGREAAVWLALA